METGDFSLVQKYLENIFLEETLFWENLSLSNDESFCSICIQNKATKSIFTLKFDEKTVFDILEKVFSWKFSKNRKFHNICLQCYTEIVKSYIFFEKFQRSVNFLESLANKSFESLKEDSLNSCDDETSDLNFPETSPCDISENFITDARDIIKQKLNNFEMKIENKDFDEPTENLLQSNFEKLLETGIDEIEIETETENEQIPVKVKTKKSNKNIFSCKTCKRLFSTLSDYKNHQREFEHDKKRKLYPCKVCNKHFSSFRLKEHVRIHTKEQPYQCNICFRRFNLRSNLNRHKFIHTGEKRHKCDICGKGFIQSNTLNAHKKIHEVHRSSSKTEKIIMTCSTCGMCFKRIGCYNRHMKNKHLKKQNADDNEEKKDAPRDFTCDVCNAAFMQKYQLKAHMKIHGEKAFLCYQCGKSYSTNSALNSHLKVHTGEKPYKCMICSKTFAHYSTLNCHNLTHTGVKPYKCKFCPKEFTQFSHLTYHLRTHSGERPYSCSFCGKSFALKGNLTVHTRMHTGETPYVCHICRRGFYDSNSMKKHIRAQHGLVVKCLRKTPVTESYEENIKEIEDKIEIVGLTKVCL